MCAKFLWKVFGAFAIFHAWTPWVQLPTRRMDHVSSDYFKQLWIILFGRDLSRDKVINLIQVRSLSQPNEEMQMRKTPEIRKCIDAIILI